ncbi:MAG: ATP-binding protein [Gemmatimonadota bacterium]
MKPLNAKAVASGVGSVADGFLADVPLSPAFVDSAGSDTTFRLLADAMPQIVWSSSADGSKIEFINRRFCEYTGLSMDESLDDPNRVIHPDDATDAVEKWKGCAVEKKAYENELRMRSVGGTYRWFLVRSVPILDQEGDVLRWVGTSTDIDDSRRDADDAHFLSALSERIRLAGTEGEFLGAAVGLIAGHFCANRSLIVEINGERGSIRAQFARSQPLAEVEYRASDYSPDARAEMEAGRAVVNRDAKADPRTAALYENVYGPQGERAYVAIPMLRQGTWVAALYVSVIEPRDWNVREVMLMETAAERVWLAVEKLRLMDEQRRSEVALREADRRKDEFLATLAHELRNPLSPIRNSLYLLRSAADAAGSRPGGMPSPQHPGRIIDMLERQVNHLVRLVDDLMEISRITRGRIELRPECIDLTSVVNNAIETSRPVIDQGRHRLVTDLPAEPVPVVGDPVRLTQVVSNLLNNAARYTNEGGVIEIAVSSDSERARLTVRDNGIGIESGMLDKVFDLFMQAGQSAVSQDRSGAGGGLGIGLTLVRSLVLLHGGEVSAHSEGPGRGSQFTMMLPLLKGDVTQTPDSSLGSRAASSQRSILVIDDNRDAADSLAMLLTFAGAQVKVAYSGEAAMDSTELLPPDAIVLDIGMPGMNGYEVARAVRQRWGSAVVLIALTGWGQEEDRRRARAAGFDHHLIKPPDIDALQALIAAIPDGRARGVIPEVALKG